MQPVDRRNIRYLYAEMGFAALMAGIAGFGPALAIRLGASGTAIAWLLALPALLGAVVGIPAGLFLTTRRQRKVWFLTSLVLARLGYLVVALVPFLFPVAPGYWVVAILVVFALPLAFFQSGWNGFLGDLLPTSRRVAVLSWRNVIYAGGLAAGAWLGGQWLMCVPFPTNYSLLFGGGFLLTLGSDYFVTRLTIDASPEIVRAVRLTPPMRRLLGSVFAFALVWSLALPLLPLYFIHTLAWSDGWLGAFGAASGLGVMLGYRLSPRLTQRGLGWAAGLTGLLPLLLLASNAPGLIVLTAFGVSAAWASVDLLTLTRTLDLAPVGGRLTYVGWYTAALSAGSFLGPLLGVALVAHLDYGTAFAITALVRLGSAGLFWSNRPDDAVSAPARAPRWAALPVALGLLGVLVYLVASPRL